MRQGFTIALLVFEAIVFNVFIPIHTRGMIELPGSRGASSCCQSHRSSDKQTPSDQKRAANCAVCAFAARVVTPPAIDFAPPPSGLAAVLSIDSPERLETISSPLPYFGRAPPGV
jgi:hypothetical protein